MHRMTRACTLGNLVASSLATHEVQPGPALRRGLPAGGGVVSPAGGDSWHFSSPSKMNPDQYRHEFDT
jgi:hypothetical protein